VRRISRTWSAIGLGATIAGFLATGAVAATPVAPRLQPTVPFGSGELLAAATDDQGRTTAVWKHPWDDRKGFVSFLEWSTLDANGGWSPAAYVDGTYGSGHYSGARWESDDADVAVAPSGLSLLAWDLPFGGIAAAIRPVGRAAFSADPIRLVEDPTDGEQLVGLDAAIGSDGTGIVAWVSIAGAEDYVVEAATMRDGRFGEPEVISYGAASASSYPAVAVDDRGNVHVLFVATGSGTTDDVVSASSTATSTAWSVERVDGTARRSQGLSDEVALAAGRDGRLAAAWTSSCATTGCVATALGTTTAGFDSAGVQRPAIGGAPAVLAGVPAVHIDAAGAAVVTWFGAAGVHAATAPVGGPFGEPGLAPGSTGYGAGSAYAGGSLLAVVGGGADRRLRLVQGDQPALGSTWAATAPFTPVVSEFVARPVYSQSGHATVLWSSISSVAGTLRYSLFARSTIRDRAAPKVAVSRQV
jgi:hypothetical protein